MEFISNGAYISRRSPVASLGGAVASSQPAATQAGIEVLQAGGTAADAAVAAAATLQVTQPCSTGIGGDAFCLYYEASSGTVHALNGSGRSPAALDLAHLRASGFNDGLPPFHAHTVTVPGAAAAWEDTVNRFGALPLSRVLEPARRLAERGFPVSPLTSLWWTAGAKKQLAHTRHGSELCMDGVAGRGPGAGERFRNAGLAAVLERIAERGSREVYEGMTAERIVEAVTEAGGLLSLEDMRSHESEWVAPVSVDYRGVRVWECPPNGQGFAALSALNTLSFLDPVGVGDPNATHMLVECMRLGFADAQAVVADPDAAGLDRHEYEQTIRTLLSPDYGRERASRIDPLRAMQTAAPGKPAAEMPTNRILEENLPVGDDTVYLSTSDRWGNGCSFINSNFMGFGTGIVPRGCGFSLQNRGYGFSLQDGHPNALAPRKRPYHTIIPGMATNVAGGLHSVFGVMGGMMQPQGHLQVISAMVDYGMDPQAALDRPRFQLEDGQVKGSVLMEKNFEDRLSHGLHALGHDVRTVDGIERFRFGLGQIIRRDGDVVWAGSDSRGDGLALSDGMS